MCQRAERVGIAFKVDEVAPLAFSEPRFEGPAFAFAEEGRDGFFSRVAEWRVAEVVGQTGGGNYVAQVVENAYPRFIVVFRAEGRGNFVGHRFADRGDFERVGQTVVDKDTAGQRKNLGLVLEAAEGRREDEPVEIAAEIGPGTSALGVGIVFKTKTTVVDEPAPFHFFHS